MTNINCDNYVFYRQGFPVVFAMSSDDRGHREQGSAYLYGGTALHGTEMVIIDAWEMASCILKNDKKQMNAFLTVKFHLFSQCCS